MSSIREFLKEPAPLASLPRTSLFIAHRLATIKDCDQILVLKNGKVVESGTHKELLQIPRGLYYSIWSSQQAHKHD
jgi:ABC-type multidrug transport system fused ATPase/permease subunit